MRAMISKSVASTGIAAITLFTLCAGAALAADAPLAPGLAIPAMDPVRGKELFASKGCVVCHQVHGVGGTDAPSLDVSTMAPVMNPFDFFAKMWHGAEGMIAMQKGEIGEQIQFSGQDLADIVAFAHNKDVQQTFTEDDIPENIKKLMEEGESEGGMKMDMMKDGKGMMDDSGGMMEQPKSSQ